MTHLNRTLTIGAGTLLIATGLALGDGFLWLGCEFQQEGNLFRYNINAGTVDLVVPIAASDHWNNIATDEQYVYAGNPTTDRLVVSDLYTGAFVVEYTHSEPLSGHKEDGAYNPVTGNLWRMTFSGPLHETTTTGDVVNSYSVASGLVGAAWVNDTLYAGNYNNGTFGRIEFDRDNASFVSIPWSGDSPSITTIGALAHDQIDDVFYLIGQLRELYCITVVDDVAYADFIMNLADVGFPSGGLADGMGWAAPPKTCFADIDLSGEVDIDDLLAVLGQWGRCPDDCAQPCGGDLDNSGVVDVNDLLILLGSWGPCP